MRLLHYDLIYLHTNLKLQLFQIPKGEGYACVHIRFHTVTFELLWKFSAQISFKLPHNISNYKMEFFKLDNFHPEDKGFFLWVTPGLQCTRLLLTKFKMLVTKYNRHWTGSLSSQKLGNLSFRCPLHSGRSTHIACQVWPLWTQYCVNQLLSMELRKY